MYCVNCGAKIDDGLNFCTECGCRIGIIQQPQYNTMTTPMPQSNIQDRVQPVVNVNNNTNKNEDTIYDLIQRIMFIAAGIMYFISYYQPYATIHYYWNTGTVSMETFDKETSSGGYYIVLFAIVAGLCILSGLLRNKKGLRFFAAMVAMLVTVLSITLLSTLVDKRVSEYEFDYTYSSGRNLMIISVVIMFAAFIVPGMIRKINQINNN